MRAALTLTLLLLPLPGFALDPVGVPARPQPTAEPPAAVAASTVLADQSRVGDWPSAVAVAGPATAFRPTQEATADPYLFWAEAEYLLWWTRGDRTPIPLLTTGPADAAAPGLLGASDTIPLLGDMRFGAHALSGGRWQVGSWFCTSQSLGVEVTGFLLERSTASHSARSDLSGSQVLTRPFVDAQTGQELTESVAFPNRFAGAFGVSSRTRFWGLDADLLGVCWGGAVAVPDDSCLSGDYRLGLLGGFRYLDLQEDLTLTETSLVLPEGLTNFGGSAVPQGSVLTLVDRFRTRDQFFGGQLGARAAWYHGRFSADLLTKLGFGVTHEVVGAVGATTLLPPVGAGLPATLPGGLLVTSTNSDRRVRDRFGIVPEMQLRLGYQVTAGFRLFVGYDFLYWGQVARPGMQLDRTVNLTRVPTSPIYGPLSGPARPRLPSPPGEDDFWAQGLSFGFELRF